MYGEKYPLPIFPLQWEVKMIMKCSSIPLAGNYSTCQRLTRYSMLPVVMLLLTSPALTPAPLNNHLCYYPPLQKTMGVSPWMNATVGPSEAQRAPGLRSRSGSFGGVGKESASANFAEDRKDTTGLHPWRVHFLLCPLSSKGFSSCVGPWSRSVKLFTSVDKHVDKLTPFTGVNPLA